MVYKDNKSSCFYKLCLYCYNYYYILDNGIDYCTQFPCDLRVHSYCYYYSHYCFIFGVTKHVAENIID